jgi:hypothetical protein
MRSMDHDMKCGCLIFNYLTNYVDLGPVGVAKPKGNGLI